MYLQNQNAHSLTIKSKIGTDMKNHKEDQNKLFKALFNEDEKLSKEQRVRVKELLNRETLPEKEQKAFEKAQKLQFNLNSKRAEHIKKAFGMDKISEDEEISQELEQLDKAVSKMMDHSGEIDESFDDCDLPPAEDLMSRQYPGRSNSGSSINYTFQTTQVTGEDDDQMNNPDPDKGEAEINGPNYKVQSFSDNGSVYSTHIPVVSTATINFRLQPRRPYRFSELVVKAHLQGKYSGGSFDMIPFSGKKYYYAWLKLDIYSFNQSSNQFAIQDSVKVNVMEPARTRYDYFNQYSHVQSTSFTESLKARTDVINNNSNTDILVSVTVGTEALAPPTPCLDAVSYWHDFKDINKAQAALRASLCAVDIGILPAVQSFSLDENDKHPLLDFIEM
jgi:predicted small metal-binding protein